MNNLQKGSAVILFGSPRKDGFTAKLTNEFIAQLQSHYKINIINAYYKNISPCISCGYCLTHDSCFMPDFKNIDTLIKSANLIVIATPVYNLGVPAPLKAIFDRMQPYFNAKVKRKSQIFKNEKTGILLLTCGDEKSKCESILTAQLSVIFTVLNAKLKYHVTLGKTDFEPNLDKSFFQIREICNKLK